MNYLYLMVLREQKIIILEKSSKMGFLLSSKKMGRKTLPECGCLKILVVCVRVCVCAHAHVRVLDPRGFNAKVIIFSRTVTISHDFIFPNID